MLTETKLNFLFPDAQFYMKFYSKSYKLHRNNKGGSIILYIVENILSKLMKLSFIDHDKEYFSVELTLIKLGCLRVVFPSFIQLFNNLFKLC